MKVINQFLVENLKGLLENLGLMRLKTHSGKRLLISLKKKCKKIIEVGVIDEDTSTSIPYESMPMSSLQNMSVPRLRKYSINRRFHGFRAS